jgi:predicted dehydrogenase
MAGIIALSFVKPPPGIPMKIGYLDHNLHNYHSRHFLALLRSRGADVAMAWESRPKGPDWCKAHKVRRADSAAEVIRLCDALVILAPNDLGTHPALAKAALTSGKPVLVDKLLCPRLKDAEGMMAAAKKAGTPLFSASALRYAGELKALKGKPRPDWMLANGMGAWDIYGVHTLSLVLAAMGDQVVRLRSVGQAPVSEVILEFKGGRRAWLTLADVKNGYEEMPWTLHLARKGNLERVAIRDFDGFYRNLMGEALKFFKTGRSPLSGSEMLTSVEVLEKGEMSRKKDGAWIRLKTGS